MSRISQLAQQTQTLSNILNAQKRIQDTEIQISSGYKSQTFTGISSEASRLVSLEGLKTRFDQLDKNNTLIEARLERMDQSVATIFDAMSELRNLVIQRINAASGDSVPLAAVAQNLLDVVAGQLNAKANGRFLFSGTQTNTAAVTIPVPDPTTFGVPEANYYQGNSTELSVRIDDTITIAYGMTADRTAFQESIAAMKAAIQGDATNNTTLLTTALSLADSAIASLAGFRAEIGSDLSTIDRAKQRNEDFVLFVEQSISEIQYVDIPSAITQLTADQTILQASFLSIARVGSLSLVNFLK